MNTDKTNNLVLWGSIAFVLLVLLGFGSLWYTSRNANVVASSTANVDVVQTEAKAEKLLTGRDNLSGMPVSGPTSDSVGKTNPFQ